MLTVLQLFKAPGCPGVRAPALSGRNFPQVFENKALNA
jgi:hypothetical protein